jgi:alpha-methylacyl-CoA racemase
MMLADMGADVLRLDRAGDAGIGAGSWNLLNRSRPSVAVDLKHPDGRALVTRLARTADALLEGFRPGVMERLGLGPSDLLAENPRLVYGRMTGYGQDGPRAHVAGHDINYLATSGVLHMLRRSGERPLAPLNLVADFGGGGMLLAFGIVCALLEARASGKGQIVDAAMMDGSALLATMVHGLRAAGMYSAPPGENWFDSGAHWYEVYETADGGHVAVGALEPQFYAELLSLLGLDPDKTPQWDPARWPELKELFAAVFRERTRAEWAALLDLQDACVSSVLSLEEAIADSHNVHRGTFVEVAGVTQPAPAPRFSRTPGTIRRPPARPGADSETALAAWDISSEEIDALRFAGAITSVDD